MNIVLLSSCTSRNCRCTGYTDDAQVIDERTPHPIKGWHKQSSGLMQSANNHQGRSPCTSAEALIVKNTETPPPLLASAGGRTPGKDWQIALFPLPTSAHTIGSIASLFPAHCEGLLQAANKDSPGQSRHCIPISRFTASLLQAEKCCAAPQPLHDCSTCSRQAHRCAAVRHQSLSLFACCLLQAEKE